MNISLFKTIIFTFIFSSIIFPKDNSEVNSIKTAEEYIKHADTYYWLSRARGNDVTDINKAISYFNNARNELKKAEKSPANDRIERKIEKGLTATITQLDAVESKIHNYFPLFSLLLNQDNVIVFFYDTRNIAIENSIVNLLFNKPFNKLGAKYVIPLSYKLSERFEICLLYTSDAADE